MAVLQQYKCPCCDGAIEFDSQLQKMKCPFCDSEFVMETLKQYDAELNAQPQENMNWDTAAGAEWQPGEEEGLRVYTCNTCGGEIVADETTRTSIPGVYAVGDVRTKTVRQIVTAAADGAAFYPYRRLCRLFLFGSDR